MASERTNAYIAQLILSGRVIQTLEFEAADDRAAWLHANDGIDPLRGLWVSVERKPEPQQAMDLPPAPDVPKQQQDNRDDRSGVYVHDQQLGRKGR